MQRMKPGDNMVPIAKVIKELPAKSKGAEVLVPQLQESECPVCNGSGFLYPMRDGKPVYDETMPCECSVVDLKVTHDKHLVLKCQLPPDCAGLTFEKFDKVPGTVEAYKAAHKVADGELEWLILMGDWDRGKTHLAVSICRRWLLAGKPARYAYVPIMFDELRAGYRDKAEEDYNDVLEFFKTVPLLVLDDLPKEKEATRWERQKLETIIDYRGFNHLPLVITTNATYDELPPRIASRLQRYHSTQTVIMDGKEYRLHKEDKNARI